MPSKRASSLIECFSILPDPRRQNHNNKKHELLDIIIIAVLAVISNAETWVDIESFGNVRYEWLKQFLLLRNGIPSHDTFARVFSILDPRAFQECFLRWINNIRVVTKGEVIAIDGKTARRSYGRNNDPLHIVSAFATDNGISLGQLSVDSKTNEIKVIPDLLDMLMLKDCIVTIDAMGCQENIVKKITENKGDYVLAVKGNQKKLLNDITQSFDSKKRKNDKYDYMKTEELSHGRREMRECWVSDDLSSIGNMKKWDNLTTVAMVSDTRIVKGKKSIATRYFISSLGASAKKILDTVRKHWQVENTLHWTLDVVFNEDDSRARIGYAQENLALVRKLALNIIRKHTSKDSMRLRRFKAALNPDFLLELMVAGGS